MRDHAHHVAERGDRLVEVVAQLGVFLGEAFLQPEGEVSLGKPFQPFGQRFDGRGLRFLIDAEGAALRLHDGRRGWRFERVAAYEATRSDGSAGGNRVLAPMPGRIVVTRVQPGDAVSEGQELLVMEAMKMELTLKAPRDGVVAELRADEGDFVDADAVLVTLED